LFFTAVLFVTCSSGLSLRQAIRRPLRFYVRGWEAFISADFADLRR